ncbi:MAG: manganese efflux pump [Thermoflexales bacterium]|nr:manganese efflux pump [Thermoflexales bacterium]
MSLIEVILIAIGLAMDALAVSLGIGAAGRANAQRARFRLAFHFGLFQGLMPILGWLGGTRVEHLISSFDHWIAFGLLLFVGGRMIRSGLSAGEAVEPGDPSRGSTLLILSIATSIDALAVGLSLAVLRVDVLQPSLIIGVITAFLSMLGLLLGNRVGAVFGKRAEVLGGLVLIGIGLRVLATHMM